jgi:PPOX class probable F420-dependent enzyme
MMTERMTAAEMHGFLLAKPARTAKLATVRPDGRPHVVPVWFDLDGDTLLFTTWHESLKASNIENDPHVAISVDDERPPFAFVLLEGIATIERAAPDLEYWTTRIAARYMGEEEGRRYGERNAVDGEWLVHVRITHRVAQKELAA